MSLNEWSLGLCGYTAKVPDAELYRAFYEFVISLLTEINASPTFIAAEGSGYTGKYVPFEGRVRQRLLKSGFENISVLSLAANPPGSDDPSYSRFAACSLSFTGPDEIVATITINDALLPFGDERFQRMLTQSLSFYQWSFGFGLRDSIGRQPEFHVLGLNNGRLGKDEDRELRAWYKASSSERRCKARNIYPLLVLNQVQVHQTVQFGMTLESFIKSDSKGRWTEVKDLLVWEIPDSRVIELRRLLKESNAFLTLK